MAFTEALRLLVTADVDAAVRGVEKLGTTTARELSRSEKNLDKWGNRLTTLGTGMVAFGAAAVVGLGALARESEEANLSQVKLQNTINNMPKLAGATAKEFTDLADSIQDVTAADADAIVEAEALLGTFNLTAQEIKNITPLVVDYARKFGVDMADAAVQVGKALDGQVGALKRNGVSIDETLFKTDRYRAVQEALSDQVGGFAEAEGKTFAGSLERMKNELGDLAEGVGGGAVDAFTTMFGAVDKVAGAFESISPGAQNLIGQVATFGAVALLAVGGVTTLIGQVIKARIAFLEAAAAMRAYSAAFITVGQVGAVVGILIGLRQVLGTLGDELDRADLSKLENQLLDLANTGKVSGDVLTKVFKDVFSGDGLVDLSQGRKAIDDLDAALAKLAARDPEAAAEAFKQISDRAKDAGASTELVRDRFDDYNATLAESDTANRTTGEAIDAATGVIEDQGAAADDTEGSVRDMTSALEDYANALRAQFDPLFGMISALQSQRDAAADVAEAQQALTEAQAAGDPTAIAEAQQGYTDALIDAGDAAFGVQQKQLELNDAISRGDVNLEDAQKQMFDWMIQAGYTADQALIMAGALGDAAGQAHNLGAQDPNVLVSTTGVTAVTADLANIKAKADAIPRSVNIDIISTFKEFFGGSSRGRQHGGPVKAGEAYIVGEKRPELFVPNENGMIWPALPNAVSGGTGGGGGVIEVHSHVYLDGREVAESVRKVVRTDHGGNVQNALGYTR
jgi:hypothetical protein